LTAVLSGACAGVSSASPAPRSGTHAPTKTPVVSAATLAETRTTTPPPPAARPTSTPTLFPPPPPPVAIGDPTRPAVYLTFDDGYGYTNEVLQILQERNTPATACLIGSVIEANPEFVRNWVAAGFTVCNHTFWHGDLTLLDEDDLRSEIELTQAALARAAPEATMLPFMRPPLGLHNDFVRAVAASLGYRVVLWSLDPEDWRAGLDAETVRQRVVEGASNGDIILLHFRQRSTVEALPSIIDGLRERGFEILGLETLVVEGLGP
jgi:peptidoglycan/xylan/chitin deacetylase (PgdA/CDA1 family)